MEEHKGRTANVAVSVRIRPMPKDLAGASASGCLAIDERDSTIEVINTSQKSSSGKKSGGRWTFNVNGILNTTVKQEQVFDSTAKDMVHNLLQG